MKSLVGKTAVVTGANRGLGLAFVQELLAAGVGKVFAFTRHPDVLQNFFAGENRVQPLKVELRDVKSIKQATAEVREVDLLINNAAMLTPAICWTQTALIGSKRL